MKRGFTLVELLAIIVVLAILSGIAVVSISSIIANGRNKAYEDYEKTLKNGAQNYLIEHFEKMPTIGNNSYIYYEELMTNDASYKSLKDPNGKGDCNDSYIIVSRGADTGINYNLDYKVCLVCPNFKSDGC